MNLNETELACLEAIQGGSSNVAQVADWIWPDLADNGFPQDERHISSVASTVKRLIVYKLVTESPDGWSLTPEGASMVPGDC